MSIGWYQGAIDQGASDGSESYRMSERFYKRRNRGSDGSGSKERDKEESKDRSIREQAIDGRSDGCHNRWIGEQAMDQGAIE